MNINSLSEKCFSESALSVKSCCIYLASSSRTGFFEFYVCVAVNFFLQLNFILPLFLGMVMYDNEFKTKEE